MLKTLADRVQFIVYRRSDKVPIKPDAPQYHVDAQLPGNWMTGTNAQAWATYLGDQYGVGFVICEGGGIGCIDIDHAWDGATWSPLARELCARFTGAYQEVSQGGAGIHIFFSFREVAEHRKKNVPLRLEFYTGARFIGITEFNASGNVLFDATDLLPKLIADYFTPSAETAPAEWTTEPHPDWSGPTDDDELLRRMLNSRSPRAIFGDSVSMVDILTANGPVLGKQWPSSTGNEYDASSVDQSAANRLAWWTGGDCERIERILRSSQLPRAKWDDRPGYLTETILKAAAWQKTKGYYKGTSATAPVATVPAPAPGVLLPPVSTIPLPPDALMAMPPAIGRGDVVVSAGQIELWKGCAYVEDIHRIVDANGLLLDSARFDVRYGGREYIIDHKGGAPCDSAWEVFTKSKIIEFPQVRGTLFDPLSDPGLTVTRDGLKFINVYVPIDIRAEPGDVTLFTDHLKILFPHDWRILLNYLKFMVQHRGKKAKWWPFLQGVPGNGKSFISTTMQYCIGKRYTQKPTPKNIDSQFNASLYACLFVALEDVKVADDYGALWETLKPMITEDSIEIQPKGIDKVTREICFNGILNSNHKDGIRKERDDRRIAPFFSAQQQKADLKRDGLTPAYFTKLWSWAQADGWAHVAHYLAHDPIDDEYNPATQCMVAPITSSTDEAIELSLGIVEQTLLDHARLGEAGFKGGWVNMRQFELMCRTLRKSLTPSKRRDILESMDYVAHPGLIDGRMPIKLTDGTLTSLYVKAEHSASGITDALLIKHLYETAQRA